MLTVSIITNFINLFNQVDYLRESITTWKDQTQPSVEILLADSSKPGPEQDMVINLCEELGVDYTIFPFNYYRSNFCSNSNALVAKAKGDAILFLCPMWWFRERTWIERMAKRLKEYGPGTLLATDNDRRKDWSGQGYPDRDEFEGQPDIFSPPHYSYIDNPKLMVYRSDWIPMDTDFDPPPDNAECDKGNAHGLVYWGHQWQRAGKRIFLCRDFQMIHAPRQPFTYCSMELAVQQVRWSETILHRKGL